MIMILITWLLVIHSVCCFHPAEPLDQAVFVWDIELIDKEQITDLESQGFNKIYLYCPSDTDLFEEKLTIISEAHMSVYALNGSYTWIDKPKKLVEFFDYINGIDLIDYPHFQGVILDIEPYVLKDRDQDADYKVFQDLILQAQDQIANELTLNVVIPFWYDDVHLSDMTPEDSLAKWVIQTADETTIMAYRNELYGDNGLLTLIENEVDYSNDKEKKLIVSLETRPSQEGNHISFDKDSKEKVLQTLHEIKMRYNKRCKYIHYGIHDLESWLNLK